MKCEKRIRTCNRVMEQILQMITDYGLEPVVIALLINFVTGLIKIPIKAWTSKLKDYTKVTRFIVFFPIGFGFLFTFCYAKLIQNSFSFDKAFITLWLTASSLSLTFYAIFEKIFPSNKNLLSECEVRTSETILEMIKQLFDAVLPTKEEKTDEKAVKEGAMQEKAKENKIILRGKGNAEVEAEK